jgi:predicted nucleic acid-binding protein
MSPRQPDRGFLDANVLFSAAYRPDAGLRRLWQRRRTELMTSRYALEEAMVNLPEPDQRQRLSELMDSVTLVPESTDERLPLDVDLPPKDRPILTAALRAGASHLVTGDLTHFGRYLGRSVQGTRILTPAALIGKARA